MGFMNVLKFSAACFDILAWPLFALGYPLCASIRAIETNSISDFRKLVAYWVLFSLISLFDHAFSKLLEWNLELLFSVFFPVTIIKMFNVPGLHWKCEEPNVAEKEIQDVKVTDIKNGGDGAKRCEWPNAAKEVKVTEVTHRTFGGTAQWLRFHVICKWLLIFH
uniref:HVA22-like protein n=1 Tax=Vitis vinifera TaxID=29760 RepID=A5B0L9_VITVI|nr:hypothetical protein VITISV_029613 [Vitis vinifera]